MLSGTGVALITPFTPDTSIDYTALSRLIDRQIAGGIDYIVVMGTTAETPTISPDERVELAEFIADHVDHRVPLVLGCGGNCTREVIDQLRRLNTGRYEAVLSVTPYYNRPTQRGLYAHYEALAEATPIPIILYNVPTRTGVNLEAETTLALANDSKGKIIGIKEASGRIAQVDTILQRRPEGFKVISGDDAITAELLAMGADGVISVLANAMPREFSEMVRAGLAGDGARTLALHRSLQPLFAPLGADGNPAGIKTMLAAMGLIDNVLRLPLVRAGEKVAATLKELVAEMKLNS